MKAKQSQKSKLSKAEKKQLKQWEEDVPSSKSRSIQEREGEHGFWGNSTTGYIYDKDLRKMM
jgi:hypothetical protein